MVIMRSVPFPENRGRIIGCSLSGHESSDDGGGPGAGVVISGGWSGH